VQVRKAEPTEVQELARIWYDAWQDAHGTGIAAAPVADAEEKLAEDGVEKAWLSCAIGNERAARFYEKCGWRRTGTVTGILETADGGFPLDVWRYEKLLRHSAKV
jgi:RimJ/RimL family protein N-acetyltransferase